jgi:hypothetical protein
MIASYLIVVLQELDLNREIFEDYYWEITDTPVDLIC